MGVLRGRMGREQEDLTAVRQHVGMALEFGF